ncbi:MAG: hypothetical protein H6622_08895 [Halobacteriovoraceae bacterium]|nr:hypothetical protein [Halobacteriovoraceae bacterium]
MLNIFWINFLILFLSTTYANTDKKLCKNSTQIILENNDLPFIQKDMVKIVLNHEQIDQAIDKGWQKHATEGTSVLSRLNRARMHLHQKLLMKFSRNGELFQYSNPDDETAMIAMVYAGRFDSVSKIKMQDRLDDLTKIDNVSVDDVVKIVSNWKDEWNNFIPIKTSFFRRLESNRQIIDQLREIKTQTSTQKQLFNRLRDKNSIYKTKYLGVSGEFIKPITFEIERIDGHKISKVIRYVYEIDKEIDELVTESLKIDNTFITRMFFTNKKGSLSELNIRQGFLYRKLSMVNDALIEIALTYQEKGQDIPAELVTEINGLTDMLGDHLLNKSLLAYITLETHLDKIQDPKLYDLLHELSLRFQKNFGDNAHIVAKEIEKIMTDKSIIIPEETKVTLSNVFNILDKLRRIRPSYKSMDEVLKEENKTEWKYLKMDIKKREEYLLALRFYSALTTKDKNRLGLNNLSAGIRFFKTTRYAMFMGVGLTGVDSIIYAYQFYRFYEVEREQCVNKQTELAFFKCSQKIINNAIVENDELGAILKEFGVKSPEYEKRFNEMLEQEIQKLATERVAYLNQKQAQDEFKEDVKKRLRKAIYENPELSQRPADEDSWFPFPPVCENEDECDNRIDPILGPEEPIGILPITPIYLPTVPTPVIPLNTQEMEFLAKKQKDKLVSDKQNSKIFEDIQISKVSEDETEKSVKIRKLTWLYQSYLMAYGELYLHADNLNDEIKKSTFSNSEKINQLRSYNIKLAEHYENLIELKENVRKYSLDLESDPKDDKINIYYTDYKRLTHEILNLNQEYQQKPWYLNSPWYGPFNMLPRLKKGILELIF